MKEEKIKNGVLLDMSIGLIASIIIFGIVISQLINDPDLINDWEFILVVVILSILFIPYNLVTLFYFKEDFGKTIKIDSKTRTLYIKKGNKERIINHKEVRKCYLMKSSGDDSSKNIFRNHKYGAILLNSGELIIVTNLILNPSNIFNQLNLKFKPLEQFTPRIDYKIGSGFLSKEEYKDKVDEFYETFKDKSEKELLEICRKPKIYADYAIASARKILKEKSRLKTTGNNV